MLKIIETKYNLHLPTRSNSLYLLSLKKICDKVHKEVCTAMVAKDRNRYLMYVYTPELLPQYGVIRDFTTNMPLVNKCKGKNITSYRKTKNTTHAMS